MSNRLGSKDRKQRRLAVIHRDGDICFWCKKAFNTKQVRTLDHLVPLIEGGHNGIANLVVAHGKCNRLKGGSLPPSHVVTVIAERTATMLEHIKSLPPKERPVWYETHSAKRRRLKREQQQKAAALNTTFTIGEGK